MHFSVLLRHYKTLQEICIKSVFELFWYKNAETHKEFSIWRNRTFSKSVYFKCFFHIIRYQNDKIHAKLLLIWENEATLKETCLLSVSQSLSPKKPGIYSI